MTIRRTPLPNSASLRPSAARGSTPLFSSSTIPFSAASRASARCSLLRTTLMGRFLIFGSIRRSARRILSTARSMCSSFKRPFFRHFLMFPSLYFMVNIISRSSPARRECSASYTPQTKSLMTKPSNPHSLRRMSVRSFLFSQQWYSS